MSVNHSTPISPNIIPTKIPKLSINDVSSEVTHLFNVFFPVVYSINTKTSKVIPVCKKVSKLKCSNYRLISLLSDTDKVLERLILNCLYNYLKINSAIYNFQFVFRQKCSTSHSLFN